jgi:diaminopimelate decarboxylase
MNERLKLFPSTACIGEEGELRVGGCSAPALAGEFGTPLYVFDEIMLRERCRAYRQALARHYAGWGRVAYASKAGLNLALAQLIEQEGLSLDVVSGGELFVARRAGFPAGRIHLHGNNKSPAELRAALDAGVERIVVDNMYELDLLERLAAERDVTVPIWLRLSPGVDVHTHDYRKTGLLDSKFGIPIETGQAQQAVAQALGSPHVELLGLHAHIGSQILEVAPFCVTADRLLGFAAGMKDAYGFELRELSPGGGWGIAYRPDEDAASIDSYVEKVTQAVVQACRRFGLPLPALTLEPGRSIVGPAAVALYRVGARKEIPQVRTYVAVDGGMADNIRPALYGARYTAVAAEKAGQTPEETVTIAGRFCESGDVLIRDVELPRLEPGDLLAVPVVGAYSLPMASNYNLVPRPAVVLVRDGQAQLIQRRESLEELVARDFPLRDPEEES